ncbi:hypothetical protein ACFVU3_38180 [Streptomyces sp. NPDC058052]|uniref:hypothetical protein n=1 Tax=Streptomyces sp. NPDC058052 TaxID=3346316 RepID=UPI0036DFB5F0
MDAARPYRPSARSVPPPRGRSREAAEFAAHLGRLIGRLRTLDLHGAAPAPVFRVPAGPAPAAGGSDAAL